jgi:hypothetical protein
MKNKQAPPIILIICILTILTLPMMRTTAQSNDEEADFLITLALMAVADDRMNGVMDAADLSNLRALVDDYFAYLPYNQLNDQEKIRVQDGRNAIISALDAKIAFEKMRSNDTANILLFQKMIDAYQTFEHKENPFEQASEFILMDVISSIGEWQADAVYRDMLDVRLRQDYKNTLKNQLDGNIANIIDEGDQFIAQYSDTTYDFSAGLSKEAHLVQLNQTKPLNFINNGIRDVTVSIEYFAPIEGVALTPPGLNLTVAGENRVLLAGFPQGNYTFCAHWQTDLDTDGDGIKDYDRMVTHIWLSSAAPDDPNLAEPVYVNSVGSATPIGRCDGFKGEAPQTEILMAEIFMSEGDNPSNEIPTIAATNPETGADFWDQGDETQVPQETEPTVIFESSPEPQQEQPTAVPPQETGLSLTSAELANQGEHNYQITCERSWGFSDTNSVSANWEFAAGSVTNLSSGSTFVKIAENIYQNDFPTTITFTTSGYQLISFVYETDSDGTTTTYETNCTANFQ